ncbi:hypothetical protein [Amycolatopsis sp.]|uniref:hypothetical protein n=1 Tax=Amycolatopsis sp. TaxID=37632 RepID=UPI002D7EAD95|nr:hypothetical protein [Amycolatopsis sp.]HET6703719.1 hypothetical protein [Amycolatopsis sp.]
MRGPALRRDHVIAASLAGAVVIVVGYASGIGLRPGTAAATPPVVADGGHPVTPQTPAPQPVPTGRLPTGGPVSPLPALPVGDVPAAPMPPMPGDGGVVAPVPDPGTPGPGSPPPSTPPPSTPPTPPPPGTDVPACQPGVPQQVLDTVGGLPLLGAVTTGLGVTGPDGAGALVLGYCRTADGGLEPAMVPAATVLSGR